MHALKTIRRYLGASLVLLTALMLSVTPSCSSDDEAEQTPQDELRDEADFDPSDGAG